MQLSESPILMDDGFIRIYHIVGCRRRGIKPLLPISRSAFLRRVKDGRFPPGQLMGSRVRVWSVESVRAALAEMKAEEKAGG